MVIRAALVRRPWPFLLEAAGHVVTAFDDPCEALDKISTHAKRLMPLLPADYTRLLRIRPVRSLRT